MKYFNYSLLLTSMKKLESVGSVCRVEHIVRKNWTSSTARGFTRLRPQVLTRFYTNCEHKMEATNSLH